MSNNPAQDRYNPKGTATTDFEQFRFSEIQEGQLFWRFNDARPNNTAFRKLSDARVENTLQTKSRQVVTLKANDIIYQKI